MNEYVTVHGDIRGIGEDDVFDDAAETDLAHSHAEWIRIDANDFPWYA